jgi:hypothetical protein
VTAPHGVNASGFYGLAPMHCRPNAIRFALWLTLIMFYGRRDFGLPTRYIIYYQSANCPKAMARSIG